MMLRLKHRCFDTNCSGNDAELEMFAHFRLIDNAKLCNPACLYAHVVPITVCIVRSKTICHF